MKLLATLLLLSSTALAWEIHAGPIDEKGQGNKGCQDIRVERGKKYSWTQENRAEPGLKECCLFVYGDTQCRGGHISIQHNKASPEYGRGSICGNRNADAGEEWKSMKVECKNHI